MIVEVLDKGLMLQFSHSVVSDYLWPHELQHSRRPCPSPTPGPCSNSCPSSRWYHPAFSSSFIPFSSCPQSFPASGSFQMSQVFASGSQSIGASASASVLPVNILKDISPGCSLEGLMLKLKLQYFGHLNAKNWLIGKDPDTGKDWGQEENGTREDEMVGWHNQLNGHGFG